MVKTVYYFFSVHRTLGASRKPRIPQNCPCPKNKAACKCYVLPLANKQGGTDVTKTGHLQVSERDYGTKGTTKAMFHSELALLSKNAKQKLQKYTVQRAA